MKETKLKDEKLKKEVETKKVRKTAKKTEKKTEKKTKKDSKTVTKRITRKRTPKYKVPVEDMIEINAEIEDEFDELNANKKKRKKKKKHLITKYEFIFCLLSLLIIIGICIYYGGRSMYYYSLQNAKKVESANTLNGLILNNNKVVQDGDGLHQNTLGYYFKGNVDNNYVKFANRIFRIIMVNGDESVKVISNDSVASFIWGKDTDYLKSNVITWLDDDKYGIYNATIPNKTDFLKKTAYTIDILNENKVETGKDIYKGYVTTLGISDFNLVGGKNSFLFDGKMIYLLGTNSDKEVLYLEEDGSIQTSDGLSGYGLKSVITFKKNMVVSSGDGTKDNPYVIDQGGKENFVDSYVKLGDDLWKVYHDIGNDVLRMYKVGYVTINGNEYVAQYSDQECSFDAYIYDRSHIANYLNNTYYYTLSYRDLLLDTVFNTGEFSEDADYSYLGIYNSVVTKKIGLLNIFDYVSDNTLTDYYNLNTTSNVGGIQYVKYGNGFLEEVDVREEKRFVPVISIDKKIINKNNGDGSYNNPYIVG